MPVSSAGGDAATTTSSLRLVSNRIVLFSSLFPLTSFGLVALPPHVFWSRRSLSVSPARSEAPLCKHQLAARLADAMGCTRSEVVEDEVIYELLVGECYVLV
jgi:hypothetical protein